jgi:hypothetical protein
MAYFSWLPRLRKGQTCCAWERDREAAPPPVGGESTLDFGLVRTPRKGDNRKRLATESMNMTAAETRLALDTEVDRIEEWRREELERAGYPVREAARLAERHDVDLHFATDLISRGCPVPVAVEILI